MTDGVRMEPWDGTRAVTCSGPSCHETPIVHVEVQPYGSEYAAEIDLCEGHIAELGEHARMFLVAVGIVAPTNDLDRSARAVTSEFIPSQGAQS